VEGTHGFVLSRLELSSWLVSRRRLGRLLRPKLRRLRSDERGSIVPLVLGCFLLAFVLVAGGVAAGDAFVQQSDLQSACDAAAIAGADVASLPDARAQLGSDGGGDAGSAAPALPLGDVQQAVASYLTRDSERASIAAPDPRDADVRGGIRPGLGRTAPSVLHRAGTVTVTGEVGPRDERAHCAAANRARP